MTINHHLHMNNIMNRFLFNEELNNTIQMTTSGTIRSVAGCYMGQSILGGSVNSIEISYSWHSILCLVFRRLIKRILFLSIGCCFCKLIFYYAILITL